LIKPLAERGIGPGVAHGIAAPGRARGARAGGEGDSEAERENGKMAKSCHPHYPEKSPPEVVPSDDR
jgi:hypothetical protein